MHEGNSHCEGGYPLIFVFQEFSAPILPGGKINERYSIYIIYSIIIALIPKGDLLEKL